MVPIINSWIVKLLLSRWTNRGVLDLLADLTPLRRLSRAEASAPILAKKDMETRGGEGGESRGRGWCMNELTGRNRSTVLPNNFQLPCVCKRDWLPGGQTDRQTIHALDSSSANDTWLSALDGVVDLCAMGVNGEGFRWIRLWILPVGIGYWVLRGESYRIGWMFRNVMVIW